MRMLLIGTALALVAMPATAASYIAKLDGAQQVPVANTPATGTAMLTLVDNQLNVRVTYAGLLSPITIGHIHCCAPAGGNSGVAIDFEPEELPSDLSGSFMRSYDLLSMASYTSGFLNANGGTAAGAKAALLAAFNNDRAYVNIHTAMFPAGEIRGQIGAIPEPASWAMMIGGFGLVGAALRRRSVSVLV